MNGLKIIYLSLIKLLVRFIITCPKLAILLPSIFVFTLSYNVVYDYTLREINSHLASRFGSQFSRDYYDNTRIEFSNFLDSLNNLESDQSVLSTIVFSSKNDKQKYNVLTIEFFRELKNLENNLTNIKNDIKIISPLTNWPINLNEFGQNAATDINILNVVNSNEFNQVNPILINNINKVNHLITSCQILNLYVIHEPNYDVANSIHNYSSHYEFLKIKDTSVTDSFNDIESLIDYYLSQNGYSFLTNFFVSGCISVELLLLISFILYITIAISNQHKIRSSTGLIIAWIVEIVISNDAAVSTLDYLHNNKSRASNLSNTFSWGARIFIIMVVSSRNLIRIIDALGSDNYSDHNKNIPKKLYKFYLGFTSNDKNDDKLKVLSSVLSFFKINGNFVWGYLHIPSITKVLIIDIISILILQGFCTTLFHLYFTDHLSNYLTFQLSLSIKATIIGLIYDHFLQLTYLVGIIIIDLKRYDLTDLLNSQSLNDSEMNDSMVSSDKIFDANLLSSILLKLKYPSHTRPNRSSWRYRIGEYFLKVRIATSINSWTVILAFMELIFLLMTFLSWTVKLPYEKDSTSKEFSNVGILNVMNNETDCIYNLEYLCVLIFIISISSLTFKFTNTSFREKKAMITINENDFELNDTNIFKSIDLVNAQCGHNLDVLMIESNSNSSFIVSVGLDHKILIWSPLTKPAVPKPINISTRMNVNNSDREFWPINHINISSDGSYTILVNYKNRLIKCFERSKLAYTWECVIPQVNNDNDNDRLKVLESFFRKRTVPGFLNRIILQNQKNNKGRKGSSVSLNSITSTNSSINGNFPLPMNSADPSLMMHVIDEKKDHENDSSIDNSGIDRKLNKDDFIMILATGELITISCNSGDLKIFNVLEWAYNETEILGKRLNSTKKLFTPRVNDRIVCHVNNHDIIIASSVNNSWSFRKLNVQEGSYNKAIELITPPSLSTSNSLNQANDFSSIYKENTYKTDEVFINFKIQINKPTIVTVEFVGMIIRVNNVLAELIDIQNGIILKKFHVGRFKPSTFKVSHSEPTHCKFCGCASIQSFSILYEDYDRNTIIIHTFKIDANSSKNNICLRVERDPREIRCHGFSSVTEHQYWYANIECWQLTDINMVVGVTKKGKDAEGEEEEIDEDNNQYSSSKQDITSLIDNSGIPSLRSRKSCPKSAKPAAKSWEGFIITLADGKLLNYKIPFANSEMLIVNRITCSEKFGYKSMVINFGNLIKIIYLGNDKLIENELYYSGTNTSIRYLSLPTSNLSMVNNDLLFINKRSRLHNNSLHKL